MVAIYDKLLGWMTFTRMLVVCFVLSIVLTLLFTGTISVSGSSFGYVGLLVTAGSGMVLFYFYRMAGPIVHRVTLQDQIMSIREFTELIYSDINKIFWGPDYIAWTFTNHPGVAGAKVLYVRDVKSTFKELSKGELERMLRSYEVTMGSGTLRLGTYHVRLPIDVEAFKSGVRRKMDTAHSTFDAGGPPSFLHKFKQQEAILKRIEQGIEQAYDARFFIHVSDIADTKEELENLLDTHTENIRNRFRNDMNMEVEVCRDVKLREALQFFRPMALVDDSFTSTSFFRPSRALTFDLIFQNPFVTRRMPPLEDLLYGIEIGQIKGSGIPVCWNPIKVPSLHGIIIGPTGTGKTTFARSLAIRAYRDLGVRVWVIDPAGDYTELFQQMGGTIVDFSNPKQGDKLNPFVLYGRDPVQVAKTLVEMMGYIAGVRGAERPLLERMVREVYHHFNIDETNPETWTDEASNEVTFEVLYNYLKARVDRLPSHEAVLASSITSKIEYLAVGSYKLSKGTVNLDGLFRGAGPVCFRITEPLPPYLKKIVVWIILEQLEALSYIRYKIAEDLQLIFIIDEAHEFSKPVQDFEVAGGYIEPPITRFVRMMRKRGVGLWLLTHSPTDFIPPGEETAVVFETIGTIFMFGSTVQQYLDFCRDTLALTKDEVEGPEIGLKWMSMRGEGMLRYFGDPRPIPVKLIPEPQALTGGVTTQQEEETKVEPSSFEEWYEKVGGGRPSFD